MGRGVKTTRLARICCGWLLVFLAVGCSSTLLDWAKNSTARIGMAGRYSDGTKWIPCYWTGTTRIDLPGDSMDLAHAAEAWRPSVYGDTIYIGHGQYFDGTRQVHCCWTIVDGTATRMDFAGGPGWTDAVTLNGYSSMGTRYLPGYWTDSISWTPCFWKVDGSTITRTDLTPTTSGHPSIASAIFFDGSSIYAAGQYYDGAKYVPCYWVNNGAPVSLPVPNDQTSEYNVTVWGLWVSSGAIYLSGNYWSAVKSISIPCYWTVSGGSITRTDLSDGTHYAWAALCDFSTGTLYTSGNWEDGTKRIPCFWVGTKRTDLPGDSVDLAHQAYAGDFIFAAGKTFVCGEYFDGTKQVPCYWTIQGATISRTDFSGDGLHDSYSGNMCLH